MEMSRKPPNLLLWFIWYYSWFWRICCAFFSFSFFFLFSSQKCVVYFSVKILISDWKRMRTCAFHSKFRCVLVDFSVHFEFLFIFQFACELECVTEFRFMFERSNFVLILVFPLIISDSKRIELKQDSIQWATDWPRDASLFNSVNTLFFVLIYALRRCLCVILSHVQSQSVASFNI